MIDKICYKCGFWDSDYGACTCPPQDRWYACPIESEKPENKKELEEYVEWATKDCDTCKHNNLSWDQEPCDGCCGNRSGYEPND